jgi:hypothetical protein
MPVPVLEWESSSLGVVPAATSLGCITGLVDVVNARVAAFPGQALWEVASSLLSGSSYVVLKPTSVAISAGANPDMRVMVFGGAAPASAVVSPYTANSQHLYVGIAPNAGVDTPDNAYSSDVPFNTGSWRSSAITTSLPSFVQRVQYFEYVGGIFIVFRHEILNTSGRIINTIVGECGTSLDDEDIYYVIHGSYLAWPANVDSSNTVGNGNWIQPEDSNSSIYSGTYYSTDGAVWSRCSSIWGPKPSASAAWISNGKRFFLPVICRDLSGLSNMKLRQICYGPSGTYGELLYDGSGVIATKVGSRTDISEDGPWLTNFIASC